MTARWVAGWTAGRVAIAPWQTFPPEMAAAGLTPAQTRAQVWLVWPSTRASGGAAAINSALSHVWWLRPVTWLYRLPGLRQLEDRVYHWVARHRHRFPGVTPACESGAGCRDAPTPSDRAS
jgi:predicted DCC family thiol-disulfide oxidoreductase YuxK